MSPYTLTRITCLPLEIPALPVALFLTLEAVGIALAARVREGRALAGVGVEVPLAQLVVARAYNIKCEERSMQTMSQDIGHTKL